MAVLKRSLYISLILTGCAQASPQLNIDINNKLSSCFQLQQQTISITNEVPILEAKYQVKKNISECGCKSKILSYSTAIVTDDLETQIISGQFILNTEDSFNIPIASSQKIVGDYDLNITLACALPN
ncbi:DUF2195 family protein [Moritella sp. 28]|uniref:DUF2195 family protein n=1 Tax=Moritella sp. 28 TaxID=2746232 RepID=UPI001BAAEAF5|nr:DUF2195 family protein [Moritella sp. 28]QUM85716.1 DUF2195 family protein [Moritella sp. 28]